MAKPDQWGRYRVRAKGAKSGIWSTRNYRADRHEIVPGPASDTYGAALPPKPFKKPEPAKAEKEKTQ